jgi:hypothetical protein
MATVVATGTVQVKTLGNEWGTEIVPVQGMKAEDQVLLTSYISNGGNPPNRDPCIAHSLMRRNKMALRFSSTTFRLTNST